MNKPKSEEKQEVKLIGAEVLPWSGDCKILRVGMPVSGEFLDVLTQLAKIRRHDLRRYVEEALHARVNLDLETPTDIGMDVCKNLKEIIYPQEEAAKTS